MKDKKSIIIYFSRADENYSVGYIEKGNTEVVAEYIKEITNADIFKVEPLIPYPTSYMECIEEAKVRTKEHNAPIKEMVPDISNYEVIYIGSPIYWGGMPEELFTALKPLNFNGKIVRPFTSQLREICVGAQVLDGLAIQGSHVKQSKDKVEEWI